MVAFALGVSTLILALSYGAQSVIRQRAGLVRAIAVKAQPILGAAFIAVGLAILFKFHHVVEIWFLDNLPAWFTEFSVSI